MLVSAISANHYSTVWNYNIIKNNENESVGDTTFSSLTPYSNKKTNPDKSKRQVYDSINEWKSFCHSQILKGKLDVIA